MKKETNLSMQRSNWQLYICECITVIIMLIIGLGGCIFLLAPSFPLGKILVPYPLLKNLLCGLVFGLAVTAGIANPFGKVSGAHLNPSVSLAFFLTGRLKRIDMFGYFIAQVIGCLVGTGILWLAGYFIPSWALMAQQARYGGAYPGYGWDWEVVFCAEFLATLGLILVLAWSLAHPHFRRFAMWWPVPFFGILNTFLGGVSGTSVNFTRSLGPALFSHDLGGLWIYLIAPFLGATVAVILSRKSLVEGKELDISQSIPSVLEVD